MAGRREEEREGGRESTDAHCPHLINAAPQRPSDRASKRYLLPPPRPRHMPVTCLPPPSARLYFLACWRCPWCRKPQAPTASRVRTCSRDIALRPSHLDSGSGRGRAGGGERDKSARAREREQGWAEGTR